ncbi:MAG: hypothetical protein ACK5M7_20765 [Draconibacterium sp.]
MSRISLFCHNVKKQKWAGCCRISVTKVLTGLLPEQELVTIGKPQQIKPASIR